jgi:hypothetical protein
MVDLEKSLEVTQCQIAPRVTVSHIRVLPVFVQVPYSCGELDDQLAGSRLNRMLAGIYMPGPRARV